MRALLILASVALVVCTAWFHFGVQATVTELKELSSELRKEAAVMDPLINTWVTAGPMTVEVRTDWRDDDTIQSQAARHFERVKAQKTLQPPIG